MIHHLNESYVAGGIFTQIPFLNNYNEKMSQFILSLQNNYFCFMESLESYERKNHRE